MTTKTAAKPADTVPAKGEPAPFTMPKFSIVADYKPAERSIGRTAAPNPFDEVVAALAETWDEKEKRTKAAARLVFSPDEETRVKAKCSKAANAKGYSPVYDRHADEKGNKVVSVYLIPKVTRERKPATETADETATTEAATTAA